MPFVISCFSNTGKNEESFIDLGEELHHRPRYEFENVKLNESFSGMVMSFRDMKDDVVYSSVLPHSIQTGFEKLLALISNEDKNRSQAPYKVDLDYLDSRLLSSKTVSTCGGDITICSLQYAYSLVKKTGNTLVVLLHPETRDMISSYTGFESYSYKKSLWDAEIWTDEDVDKEAVYFLDRDHYKEDDELISKVIVNFK